MAKQKHLNYMHLRYFESDTSFQYHHHHYFSPLQKIIARLSAHNHEKLHFISATSKARVYIDRIRGRPESLLIRGTREQIEAAKDLLKQLAIEEEMLESQLKESIATRHPKGSPKTAVPVDDLIVASPSMHPFRSLF